MDDKILRAFTPDDDKAILNGGMDDRTLAETLTMSIIALRERRAELKRRPAKPGKPVTPWSMAESNLAVDLRREGHNLKVIADRMGRTSHSVGARLLAMGVRLGK